MMARSIAVPNGHGDGDQKKKSTLALLLLGGLLIGAVIWWLTGHAVKVNSSKGCHAVIVDDEESFGELLMLTLSEIGCTTELYLDCDDIVFRNKTSVYFVDEHGFSYGLDECIPHIRSFHFRPIIWMSATDFSHMKLPRDVHFMQKGGDISYWIVEALETVGIMLP